MKFYIFDIQNERKIDQHKCIIFRRPILGMCKVELPEGGITILESASRQ